MSSALATPDSTSRTASTTSARDQPGGDEAGDVAVDDDAGLADRLGELPCRGQRLVAGLVAADQLAQLHHRHRREEVRADDRTRAAR